MADVHIRRVIYSVAASLDGYIAGPLGDFDWIPEEPAIDWGAFMDRFDAALLGRHTYEVSAGHVGGATMPDMPAYVFSRTLLAAEHPGVTVVADDAAGFVRRLKAAGGKDIWLMGGGVLFAGLLTAGVVDGVEVAVAPILLGQGRPLLPPLPLRTRLALVAAHTYPSGIVLLSYNVIRDAV